MNVLRTLIFGEQISLTIADTTEVVQKGIERHRLTGEKAEVFSHALSFLTYMSSALKEKTGELSLSVKTDGKIVDLSAAGNADLAIRGYLDWSDEPERVVGDGALTLVRDDGYSRPFVGACGLIKGETLDKNFEEYYRVSEQIPTWIATCFFQDEGGRVEFSAIVALQALPFADGETLKKIPTDLQTVLKKAKEDGILSAAEEFFGAKEEKCAFKNAEYRCRCSREYLKGVLVSVGKDGLKQIIAEDGEIRVHCHYCNTDYAFGERDVEELFSKE